MAARKAMDRIPMPTPIIMNSLTSLSVTQLSSSEVSMGPQLLIPLQRKLRGIQIFDWVHRNSWQLEVSLISVQIALKPLAPTALSATKNETRMRLVSEVISEYCSRLSPHNSKGVRLRSFQGQTRRVAAGQPRSTWGKWRSSLE